MCLQNKKQFHWKIFVCQIRRDVNERHVKKNNLEKLPMNMNQVPVFKSWWFSNSFCNSFSAWNALIVASPLNEADMCEKTGDFAMRKIIIQYF